MTTATPERALSVGSAEAIPFPQGQRRTHSRMSAERIKNAKSVIKQIKGRETKTKNQINEFLPEMISGVHGGDNIALVNSFLDALTGDRQRVMALFLRAMVPYSFKDGRFTKKGDDKFCAEKLTAFNKFLDSGQTVFVWIGQNTKSETVDVDYAKRAENALKRALTHGVTFEQLSAILAHVVEETEAAKAA